jgi:hypothetical protein
MYMRKVILKFQLRTSLGAKVEFGRPVSQKLRSASRSVSQKFWAAEYNFCPQYWLGLKLGDPLLIYMCKVIPKFQLRESLGAKVEIGRPVLQKFQLIKLTSKSPY